MYLTINHENIKIVFDTPIFQDTQMSSLLFIFNKKNSSLRFISYKISTTRKIWSSQIHKSRLMDLARRTKQGISIENNFQLSFKHFLKQLEVMQLWRI